MKVAHPVWDKEIKQLLNRPIQETTVPDAVPF
jgi:hypothetical protein